jgi:hypothetical protein
MVLYQKILLAPGFSQSYNYRQVLDPFEVLRIFWSSDIELVDIITYKKISGKGFKSI